MFLDVWHLIFTRLEPKDVRNVARTNVFFYNATLELIWTDYRFTKSNIKRFLLNWEQAKRCRSMRLRYPLDYMNSFDTTTIPSYCSIISDDFIDRFIALSPFRINSIHLQNCYRLSHSGFQKLMNHSKVTELTLVHCSRDVEVALFKGRWKDLKKVEVDSLFQDAFCIDTNGLLELKVKVPNRACGVELFIRESLVLLELQNVAIDTVEIQRESRLETLKLTNVSHGILDQFLRKCPLRTLELEQVDLSFRLLEAITNSTKRLTLVNCTIDPTFDLKQLEDRVYLQVKNKP